MVIRNAGGGRGLFDIGDVAPDEFLAAIFYGTDADHRRQRDDGAAHHRGLEIFLVIIGNAATSCTNSFIFCPGLASNPSSRS